MYNKMYDLIETLKTKCHRKIYKGGIDDIGADVEVDDKFIDLRIFVRSYM